MTQKVFVQIKAGLGNQIFQYVTACALANRWQRPLEILFTPTDGRLIEVADLSVVPLRPLDERATIGIMNRRSVGHWLQALRHGLIQRWVDPVTALDKRLLGNAPPYSVLLQGYWANASYFPSEHSELSSIVAPKIMNGHSNWASITGDAPSVAIHIRRGDYTDDKNKKIFNNLDVDYYSQALLYIESRTSVRRYHVFTDAPDSWKSHFEPALSNRNRTFILTEPGQTAADTLSLMARCDHIVTANSTFSWWAAKLNCTRDKIVVRPKTWYRDRSLQTAYESGNLLQMPEAVQL